MIKYTDEQNVNISKVEYRDLNVGDKVSIPDGTDIGYVSEVHADDTGLNAYVVTDVKLGDSPATNDLNSVKEVTVLYQGSSQSQINEDWLGNDFPLANRLLTGDQKDLGVTPQLKSGSKLLNSVFNKYPNAGVDVYGHSLGSMVGQYSVVNLKGTNRDRLNSAHLYEGMNIYNLLDADQQLYADELRRTGKVQNYVDPKDIVPLNTYSRSENAIGQVNFLDTDRKLNPIDQHMYKGYQYEKNGGLKLVSRESVNNSAKSAFAKGSDYALPKVSMLMALRQNFATSDGAISSDEQILLDTGEAYVVARTIQTAIDEIGENFKKIFNDAKDGMENIWSDGIDLARSVAPDLSDDEIYDVLTGMGVTKKSVVTLPQAGFDADLVDLQEMLDQFGKLVAGVQKTIDQLSEADQQMMAVFK